MVEVINSFPLSVEEKFMEEKGKRTIARKQALASNKTNQ